MATIHLDFETRSTIDLRKAGADVYARHPSTEILCVVWAIDEEPSKLWYPECGKANFVFKESDTVVAHNAPFELAIWNHVGKKFKNFMPLYPGQMQCTMAMAYAMALPGSLEKASAAVGIDQQKDLKGQRTMLQLCQPRDVVNGRPVWWEKSEFPEKYETLYSYCKQDVEVERALYKRLMQLSPREKEIWALDYKINQRGVQVDVSAATTALGLVKFEKIRLDEEMRRVTNNAVATCTATGQLTDWIRSLGMETEGVAKSDVLLLLENDQIPKVLREALLLRQEAAKSSTAKFDAIINGVCNDGRIRGMFQYHGAGTGRWAGRRIQLQNLPRPRLKQSEIESIFKILKGEWNEKSGDIFN